MFKIQGEVKDEALGEIIKLLTKSGVAKIRQQYFEEEIAAAPPEQPREQTATTTEPKPRKTRQASPDGPIKARVLPVFEKFHFRAMTVDEVANHLGVASSSVSPVCKSLVESGAIVKIAKGKYELPEAAKVSIRLKKDASLAANGAQAPTP